MQNTPRTLKIGGDTFEVLMTESPLEHPDYPGKRYRGAMIYDSKKIPIWNHGGDVDLTNITIIHEMIEAIKVQRALDLPHDSIDALSEALNQVIKDNKLWFGANVSTTVN